MELGPRGKTTKQQFATVCSCFGLALTPALINADGGARRYVNTAATLMPVPDLLTAGLGGAALGRDQDCAPPPTDAVHGWPRASPCRCPHRTPSPLGPEDLQRIAASPDARARGAAGGAGAGEKRG
ncbi:hypothetical protein CHLRE_16g672833v5 [Chlamydomonas reinhardtii]|uniref:Uncharacterized protein n=1 Tax=Chlamydomonas reinhardtii TaxID=3055 RepID=A0A2K3CVR6_CHLRE|nr:uncharacterized protein CHLRE_16g672833v5 [Chlamydomonas reinhardtii]PNW72366.1 hypothetical protein CHLRE_16g672833v5 [Chlamydomonas reinhardtii]